MPRSPADRGARPPRWLYWTLIGARDFAERSRLELSAAGENLQLAHAKLDPAR